MTEERPEVRLVWITNVYAINPAHIMLLFHGNHGEVQITLVGNQLHSLHEHDLTAEGRSLLLPPAGAARRADVEAFAGSSS